MDFISLESDSDHDSASSSSSRPTKRRRTDGGPSPNAVPWAKPDCYSRGLVFDLHEELIDFFDYVSPSDEEHKEREQVIERLAGVVNELWPDCEVKPFGSFVTKLYLPNGDIDLVVIGASRQSVSILVMIEKLGNTLRSRGMVSRLEPILGARVPLLKYTDKRSSVKVDVSFDAVGGIHTTAFVSRCLELYPPMKYLVLFGKYFLQYRTLSETFHGGVGSFLLQMMILHMFQLHPIRKSSHWRAVDCELSLGAWLLSFFELYGSRFNYERVGIIVDGSGKLYRKDRRGRHNFARPWLLSLENPLDADMDIGKNSYQIMHVRKAFEFAFQRLVASEESALYPSLLSRVVGVRDEIFENRSQSKSKNKENGDEDDAHLENGDVDNESDVDAEKEVEDGGAANSKDEDVGESSESERRSVASAEVVDVSDRVVVDVGSDSDKDDGCGESESSSDDEVLINVRAPSSSRSADASARRKRLRG